MICFTAQAHQHYTTLYFAFAVQVASAARGRFSVLVVPVVTTSGRVVGVLQAARRRTGHSSRDDSSSDAEDAAGSAFARRDVVLLEVRHRGCVACLLVCCVLPHSCTLQWL